MHACGAQVFFTLACLIAAGAVHYAQVQHGHGPIQVGGIPMFLWLILAAVVFPCIHFARWAMDALVSLLEAVAVRSGLTNVHYVLIGLSDVLRCVPAYASLHIPPSSNPPFGCQSPWVLQSTYLDKIICVVCEPADSCVTRCAAESCTVLCALAMGHSFIVWTGVDVVRTSMVFVEVHRCNIPHSMHSMAREVQRF